MDNDIVLEPGAEPASVQGSNSSQTNDGGDIGPSSSNDSKYVPEKVFEVSSDLNIKQVTQDAAQPIQYEDSKFKNSATDPLGKNIKNIGGLPSGGAKTPSGTPRPIFKPSSSPIPPPVPLPPLSSPIADEINSILKKSSIPIATAQTVNEPTKAPTEPLPQISPDVMATNLVSNPISTYPSIPEVEKKVPGMNAMRTYAGDVANVITKKGTSTAEMVMAQEKKETGNDAVIADKKQTNTSKKALIAILSLVLVGAGVVGAYYLYSKSPLAPATPVQQTTKAMSLVPSDSQKTISLDGLGTIASINKLRSAINETRPPGTIEEIIPYTTTNEIKSRFTADQMIKLLDIAAPNILTRSLTPSWMLGVYTDRQNKNSLFVVATNNFFQNAFAGMLSWENVMADDLKQYLYPASVTGIANTPPSFNSVTSSSSDLQRINPLQNIDSLLLSNGSSTNRASSSTTVSSLASNATSSRTQATTSKLLPLQTSARTGTSTATSTASSTIEKIEIPIVPNFTLRGQFQDKIIKNKDVREFVTANGDILFLYSFIDNKRLIITSNEATLTEIITRLEKEAFIR